MVSTQPDLQLNENLKNHSWLHFTQMQHVIDDESPMVITRGEGSTVWDTAAKSTLTVSQDFFV